MAFNGKRGKIWKKQKAVKKKQKWVKSSKKCEKGLETVKAYRQTDSCDFKRVVSDPKEPREAPEPGVEYH